MLHWLLQSPLPLSIPLYSHAKNNFMGTSHSGFILLVKLSVGGNGRKLYVCLKGMVQRDGTTEAEQLL